MGYAFAERWNVYIGVNDFVFECIQIGMFNSIANTIFILNIFTYYAKYMPQRIEGSIFAYLVSTNILSYNVISTVFAVLINDYLLDPPVSN